MPLSLRPPEIDLGDEWDDSVDISGWTYGCIVSNGLANCLLFKPIGCKERNVSEEAMLFYQMIMFCGEFFDEDLLTRCSRSHDHLNSSCSLKRFNHFMRQPFQDYLRGCGFPSSDEEIKHAAAFMASVPAS